MDTRDMSRRDLLARSAQLTAVAGLLPVAAQGAEALKAPPLAKGVTPFRVDIPQARIDRIMNRLRDIEWPDAPQVSDPWAYGASLPAMKDLVAYWTTKYNWRAREAEMNKFPQFKARVEDYDIHFIHVRGSGPNPQPIIISHGWPSTFIEFAKVIEPLAHPERFGGKVEDAFTVVVPSLPGFGFSSKPPKPIGTRTTGRLWEKLMADVLGYKNYIAQGGDLGFAITREMGFDAANCKAIHLNLLIAAGAPSTNDEEKAAAEKWAKFQRDEGAYSHVQNTKPLTISYAMTDSPLGHAAWIFEKVRTWSGLKNGDPWSVYTRDEVLDNIMLFIITNTYGTAAWFYAAGREEGPGPKRGKMEKPVGFAHFPDDVAFWPRSYADREYNVVRWTEMPSGGHFAAAEVPQLYVDEIRAFSRQLRT
jgi:pimeloyl-ACP methyl ester carboxylesterase